MPFNAGVTLQLSSGQYSVFLRYREFGIIAKRLFAVPEKEQCMLAGLRRGGGRNRGVHFSILGQCDTSKTSQCIFSGRKGLSHL